MQNHHTHQLPRRATGPIGKGFQRGVTVIEAVIVVSVLIVLMTLGINYLNGLALATRGAQFNDEEAREMAQLARATAQYMDTQPAATYPVGTNVAVPISSLIAAGFLPAGFANRAGSSPSVAITPLGQGYVVEARRLVAGDKPTALVFETGTASVTKTSQIGVDGYQDALVYGVKQSIAALANKNYQVIAGTIPTGSRIATGTGTAFTEDLTAYFTAGFTQSSPVAFINFKDLDPGGGGGTPTATAPVKVYQNCSYVNANCTTNSYGQVSCPGWGDPGVQLCSDPVGMDPMAPLPQQHYEHSSRVSNCAGAQITPVPVGGALVNGVTNNYYAPANPSTDCPSSNLGCQNESDRGTVTMANVTIIQGLCSLKEYKYGVATTTNYNWQNTGVCCQFYWK